MLRSLMIAMAILMFLSRLAVAGPQAANQQRLWKDVHGEISGACCLGRAGRYGGSTPHCGWTGDHGPR